jgi:hypothetical protein
MIMHKRSARTAGPRKMLPPPCADEKSEVKCGVMLEARPVEHPFHFAGPL